MIQNHIGAFEKFYTKSLFRKTYALRLTHLDFILMLLIRQFYSFFQKNTYIFTFKT